MSKQLGSVLMPGSSSLETDHTSLSDLRNLFMKHHEVVMSKFQEIIGRLMNLEAGMHRPTNCNMVEIRAPSTVPRCLKLVFRNKISLPVRTGEEIKGEGGNYIQVALVDDVTGTVVNFGQESSALVEIVALDGNSDYCERDNTWKIGNYNNSTNVSERDDQKRSVLGGQVKVKLEKGIGSLVNLRFKSSSNHNTGEFKLGARVRESFHGTVIKEAMTEPFTVKDFRQKYTEKHYPPSLSDEIWRLKNIPKGGPIYNRVKEKVKTVEEFLIQLLKDPAGLRGLFPNLTENQWNVTVNHARTCTVNQKVYCSINSQQKKGVVFNVVGTTLGLIKDLKYVQNDMLSEEDKVEARKLLSVAFMEDVKDFDNEDSLLQFLSKIGESDQSNLETSSQNALNPDGGIIVSQVIALDPVIFPPAFSGLEAPLQDPIYKDQETNNINNADKNYTSLISPSQELNIYDIFSSNSPTGGGTDTARILEAPLFSPQNAHEDFLLSLNPNEVDQASNSHGIHDLQDMDMESTNHNENPSLKPRDRFFMTSSKIDQATESYGFHGLQDMDLESTYHIAIPWRGARHRRILRGVVKWCFKLKQAAMGYRLNKNKKQRI